MCHVRFFRISDSIEVSAGRWLIKVRQPWNARGPFESGWTSFAASLILWHAPFVLSLRHGIFFISSYGFLRMEYPFFLLNSSPTGFLRSLLRDLSLALSAKCNKARVRDFYKRDDETNDRRMTSIVRISCSEIVVHVLIFPIIL